jgi:hypothetical protein
MAVLYSGTYLNVKSLQRVIPKAKLVNLIS